MKKSIHILLLIACISIAPAPNKATDMQKVAAFLEAECEQVYNALNLKDKLSFAAFEQAFWGYKKLTINDNPYLSVADFSKPSSEKRFFVLDLKNRKVLFHTYVSHGRNSGQKYATSFSNKKGSFKSSLGFYRTENSYMGRNGYSLRLDGLEKGINDMAKARAIVIHGADYCDENIIAHTGRLGRSQGCPALPRAVTAPIINTIKNGSILFIYGKQAEYFAQSQIAKREPILNK